MNNHALSPCGATTGRYAYYYSGGFSNDGYVFVSFIGMGAQGTACLVRSIRTGKLCVRKSAYLYPDENPDAEWMNATYEHPNIPRVLDAVTHPAPPSEVFLKPTDISPLPMIATYWDYKNGMNLLDVYKKFMGVNERVPETLLVQLVDQLLSVTTHLRANRVVQNDLLPCNIFLDWPKDSLLPDFYLGDYGRSRSHKLGTLGPPVALLERIDEDSQELARRLRYEEVYLYSNEIRNIAKVLFEAIYDPETGREYSVYSANLHSLYVNIYDCPLYDSYDQFGEDSLDLLNAYVQQLSGFTRGMLNLALRDVANPQLQYELDLIRPFEDAEKLDPVTQPDLLTMHGYPYRPPGPWNVVILDAQNRLIDWVEPAGVSCRYSPFITGPTGRMLLRDDIAEVRDSGLAQL